MNWKCLYYIFEFAVAASLGTMAGLSIVDYYADLLVPIEQYVTIHVLLYGFLTLVGFRLLLGAGQVLVLRYRDEFERTQKYQPDKELSALTLLFMMGIWLVVGSIPKLVGALVEILT